MRIAQVAPLYESVPPKMYGGTERIVSYLTDALVKLGHEVTLFASGDSKTKAKLIPVCPSSLRLDEQCIDPIAHHMVELQMVQDRLDEFDILHYHIDYFHFPLSRINKKPQVTTLHGRLDIPDLQCVYDTFDDMPVVSISNSQRKPLPQANWVQTVYHGIPENLYPFREGKGDYVAFIGRISPEKRVDRAIKIAKKAGIQIKIAAKVDKADREYYHEQIEHLMDHPLVDFIGEIGEEQKGEFLGNAKALLFPIDWPEPFGMAMIEAMACGTPVIAYKNGSVPEVIDVGQTGYIVNSIDEAVKALKNIDQISRHECRMVFQQRYSATRMAQDYVQVYEKILNRNSSFLDLLLDKEVRI